MSQRARGRVVAGEPVLPRAGRVEYEEARDDLWAHYNTTGSRDLRENGRFNHRDAVFVRRHEAERAARERDLRAQLADSLRREQEARAALDAVRRVAEIALARFGGLPSVHNGVQSFS